MRSLFLILFVLSVYDITSAQITIKPELASKLSGKSTFNTVWQTVYDHYQSMNLDSNRTAFREFKKWNRWAWWAARNLDSDGKIIKDYGDIMRARTIFEEQSKLNTGDRSNTGAWYPLYTNSYEYKSGNILGTGRVDRITFHPTNSNIIYVASSGGGLWRTEDGGATWYCLTNTLPNCGVTGVALDPANPSVIYIATGDGDTGNNFFVENFDFRKPSYGILVSYDNGGSWQIMGNSQTMMQNRLPFKLTKLVGYSNRLLCATTNGLLLSINNGVTWTVISSGNFFDIEQDPDDATIIFASNQSNLMRSTDGGQTFTPVNSNQFSPAQTFSARTAICFNINNDDELYYLQIGTGTNDKLYRSTDSGLTFNQVNATTEICNSSNIYMGPLAVNGSAVLTGAVDLYRSVDSGVNFIDNTNWFANSTTSPQFVHADIHDLAFNPLSNVLYAATDGGVFSSNDNGFSWAFISNGLNTLQFYHLDGIDAESNTFVGGFQDNGSAYSTDAGYHMNFFGSGDGYQTKFIPGATNMIYYVVNQSVSKYNRTSNTNSNVLTNISWFPKIACHPTNNQVAYFGFSSNIYKTTNQGTSTTIVANFGASNNAASHAGGLATTSANSNYVYAADDRRVRLSTDQGSTWSIISDNPGWNTNFNEITDIAACNGNANILYVSTNSTTNAKVLFTQDGGASWINISGSLPPSVIVYSVVSHDNGDAYIGTNIGVFYQGITMLDWVPFMNGLPMVEVSDLFINEGANKITASTFGRGLWQGDLYNACTPFVVLSGYTTGYKRSQASTSLESTQYIPGSYGNDVVYRANQSVKLKPGFAVRNGSYFRARIGNCGEGVFLKETVGDVKKD